MSQQLMLFDYGQLDMETRIVVRQRTDEIRDLVRRSAQDIIDIGQKLIEVKDRLGHGHFGQWLDAEFGWADRTAQRFMRVAEQFKSDNLSDLRIAPSALYLLAAPSTPEGARAEALERAEGGEAISHSVAKGIVQEARGGKRETLTPGPSPSQGEGSGSDNLGTEKVTSDGEIHDGVTGKGADRWQVVPGSAQRVESEAAPTSTVPRQAGESRRTGAERPVSRAGVRASERAETRDTAPTPPARPAPVMQRIENPVPVVEPDVLLTVRISPGEILAERAVMLAIGAEGGFPMMRRGVLGELCELVQTVCASYFETVEGPEIIAEEV